jgi:hypothetical protein
VIVRERGEKKKKDKLQRGGGGGGCHEVARPLPRCRGWWPSQFLVFSFLNFFSKIKKFN